MRLNNPSLIYALFWLLCAAVAAGSIVLLENPQLPTDQLILVQVVPYISYSFVLGAGLSICSLLPRLRFAERVSQTLIFTTSTLAGGWVVAAVWVNHQVLALGHVGLSNLFEVSMLLLALLGAFGVWAQRHFAFDKLGAGLAPLYLFFAFIVLWLESIGQAGPRELVPALQSNLLPWHVLSTFLGYGAFMVAAAASVVGLVAAWRGHSNILQQADTVAARCIGLGFPLFTIAILLGSLWAYQAWGGYWMWDPKETWALIVWLIYAGYLHARLTHNISPIILAWWSLIGFMATLFCYLGVNLFLGGLHSYGQIG